MIICKIRVEHDYKNEMFTMKFNCIHNTFVPTNYHTYLYGVNFYYNTKQF